MITVRLLDTEDAERFKSLRLLAIENSPTSIWPTWDEEMARPIAQVQDRIRATSPQAVFGAFDADVLVGITGVCREPLLQEGHKATIWGVRHSVAPGAGNRPSAFVCSHGPCI
ncbi:MULTISPECIES: hypothetical protein [Burkholderia]|uniref:hypothetical protein n=1 Tax=Burkholderia TaxID=32008 RepID=UPI000AEF37AC